MTHFNGAQAMSLGTPALYTFPTCSVHIFLPTDILISSISSFCLTLVQAGQATVAAFTSPT
jgi:hypothetical protein